MAPNRARRAAGNPETPGVAEIPLPDPGDPDRKRVLNVLAQRRYRQRRREKYTTLEAQAKASASERHSQPHATASTALSRSTSDEPLGQAYDTSATSRTIASPAAQSLSGGSESSGGVPLIHSPNTAIFAADMSLASNMPVTGSSHEFQDLFAGFADNAFLPISNAENEDVASTFNHANEFYLAKPSYPTAQGLNRGFGSSRSSSQTYTPMSSDHTMEVPILKVITIAVSIAAILDLQTQLWDLNYTWIADPARFGALPATFQPTAAQLTIPHHPFLDVLPWPGLRERLISMFCLPPELRPRSAREGTNPLVQLSMDVDDFADGFRIVGPDGLSEKDWEIGQAFFRHWWWAVDRGIVENTNELRRRRGLGRLKLDDIET